MTPSDDTLESIAQGPHWLPGASPRQDPQRSACAPEDGAQQTPAMTDPGMRMLPPGRAAI